MALMIPDGIEEFTTEGEKQVYKFLQQVAVPDLKYTAWYTPDIEGKEPDFILFGKDIGLIIFEVKDWNLDQIIEANPKKFVLRIEGKSESRKNPLMQARGYCYDIMDRIKKDGRLVSKDPTHRGNPIFPIKHGVIFPNINKYEYIEKGLEKIISPTIIFFWDDLHPSSDICMDSSGQCFQKTIESMFKTPFAFTPLDHGHMMHLKHLIFPSIRIELPERSNDYDYGISKKRLNILDNQQEALARKFDGGHRIIKGASGSGKSLVLVHKAGFLKKYNPKINSILLVCFNITLVNYLKRLLSAKHVPLGENGVQVMHIYQLCEELIGEKVSFENESGDYYELIIQEALARAKLETEKYDAILVDEGQDFSKEMYGIVIALLNPDTNNLTIALDDNQNIYQNTQSWSSLGINARGRVHRINYVYRNTKEIKDFASKFIENSNSNHETDDRQLELFPDYFTFHGPEPEITEFDEYDDIAENIASTIIELTESTGIPYSEIAIIYTTQSPENSNDINVPKIVIKHLESRGILYNWISEDFRSKQSYDVTTNSVSISTIHSVKGFDYACVFVIGLDAFNSERWTEENIQKLTYVSITRARRWLYIPYTNENAFIKKLKSCL